MEINHQKIEQIIVEASEQEILPRWKNLQQQDIEQKSSDEVVTAADHACEELLTSRLLKLLPGSLVVGEEGVHKDPYQLDALHSDLPVWVIDPLDGTKNYVSGKVPFSIMVCLIQHGEILAAWLYDPLERVFTSAEKGCGAFQGTERLQVDATVQPLSQLNGALLTKFLPASLKAVAESSENQFKQIHRSYCAGFDYPALVNNRMQFLFYYRTLVWDHAPGILIAQEAGAVALRFDGSNYSPLDDRKGLLCASNMDIWRAIQQATVPGITVNNLLQ